MKKNNVLIGKHILPEHPVVIYLGASIFDDALKTQGVEVISVRWRPPREASLEIDALLKKYL